MKAYFLKLFAYDLWANHAVLSELVSQDVKDEKIISWMNHIINAEKIWFERIQLGEYSTTAWENHPTASIYIRMQAIHDEMKEWLENLPIEDLMASTTSYANSKGDKFKTAWVDILAHVMNHSTHHRAQIAARMRELGFVPPATDYIFYLRKFGK